MPAKVFEYEPHRLAGDAQQFWKARRLPPPGGVLGPPDGPILHQFEGGIVGAEESSYVAYRAVAADVVARYFMLVGRRSDGSLRWGGADENRDQRPEGRLLRHLAIWTGGTGGAPWDSEDRHAKVERLVGRLARRGVIVSRDLPLRFCPTCVAPRSPERIIYQEEEGDTYLVRFELRLDERAVNALVWVDAPWRLLGTSALVVHPEAPYVVARYRRKGAEELVLTSRSSLERFREWLPDATFEVLEERPGREFAGQPYLYPLRHEFPMGGALTPPGGTILAAADITGTGTGIVPLVPGHQSTDALIAETHRVPGWPLVTPKGQLDVTLVHKYAGLDLKTASEFILRDLTEGEAVFADLRVRRGVPHCMVCGTALIWLPGRAWCLEPGRLPAEAIELYRRLLPGAPPLHHVEVAPWPVSETSQSQEPSAIALLECGQCERLNALDGPATCTCGGKMFAIRRRLVPSAADAFSAWARHDPFPSGDSVRLYVGERRRVPAVVHHLAGLTAVEGTTAAVGISILPTLPEVDLAQLVESDGADAVRSALVRTEVREGSASTFFERCIQERRRLERLWSTANDLLARLDPEMLAAYLEPISGHLGELEAEDRALLARWERARVAAIAEYDRGSAAGVHRWVFRFLETDLADYRRWIRERLLAAGTSISKRAALRTMSYVLRTAVVLLGPIVPGTSEAIFRRFAGDRRSLFETGIGTVERSLLDEKLCVAWDRWRSLLEAIAEFRRVHAIAPKAVIARAAVVLATDEEGDRLREFRAVLERLGRITRLEVASPREPWAGRQRHLRPIESEIQRAYPAQASQIAHLLRRMPPRRSGEATGPAELSVVIQGLPRRVLPSMVDYVETLPEGMVPSPWGAGELYVEIPGSGRANRPTPPPLSPDAFWLVRHIERRLKRSGGVRERTARSVVISASDPLASELRGVAEPLARYLEVAEIRIPEAITAPPPAHRTQGRTKTGARWWVDVPGLSPPAPRKKGRIARPMSRRVPLVAPRVAGAEAQVDYSDEKVIAEEEAVRTLNRELDAMLRSAALGPAKVRAAWARGFHDLDRYRSASYDELLELPGFGRGVAEGLVLAFGGTIPSPGPSRTGVARTPSPAPTRPPDRSRSHAGAPALPKAALPTPARTATTGPALVAEVGPPSPSPEPLPSGPEPISLPPPVSRAEDHLPIALPERTAPSGPPIAAGPSMVEPASPTVATEPEESTPPVSSEEAAPETEVAGKAPSVEEPATALVTGEVLEPTAEVPSAPEAPPTSVSPAESTSPAEPVPESPAEVATSPPPVGAPEGSAPVFALEEAPLAPIPEERTPAAPLAEGPGRPAEGGPPDTPWEPRTSAPSPEAEAPAAAAPEPAEGLIVPGPVHEAEELPEAPPPVPLPTEPRVLEKGEGPTDVPMESTGAVPEEPTAGEEPTPAVESTGPAEIAPTEGPRATQLAATGVPEAVPPEPVQAHTSEVAPETRVAEEGMALPEPPSAGRLPERVAPPPSGVGPAPAPILKVPQGGIELMVGASVVASLQPFLEATAAGLKGVCVVRESPERIRAQAGSRPVEIYWLTNLGRGRTVRPNDLAGFATFLAKAMDEEHAQLFFIEGVEYLTHIHGVEAVVARLAEFHRLAQEREVRVWLHVTPGLMRPGELERIVAAFPTAQ